MTELWRHQIGKSVLTICESKGMIYDENRFTDLMTSQLSHKTSENKITNNALHIFFLVTTQKSDQCYLSPFSRKKILKVTLGDTLGQVGLQTDYYIHVFIC